MSKIRLDHYLFDHKIADSRSLAQRLIMAGEVTVNGQVMLKPSQKIDDTSKVELKKGPKFVSRGGEKLEPALVEFGFTDLGETICVDVGSSTGGFTDCLLQYGAKRVYALDVGYGILHWKLRTHPNVIVMERTNARFVEHFPDPIRLVTIDASFISLKVLLPVISDWLEPDGHVIALIKPQFEAGRKEAAKGSGVIRDQEIHKRILLETLVFAEEMNFLVKGLIKSPLKGPKGNIEFLTVLQSRQTHLLDRITAQDWVDRVFPEGETEF
jgi:23S rRNA (cytidine1920-2'-O)/16S rRNA (cytidine1409-2'-O)-methyltransferase